MQGHDIVVMGGSAGGVEAMKAIVAAFPADLQAAVFVVVHTSPGWDSQFPAILSQVGPLRATHAIHGEPITLGHIYVAPPDNHILVRGGYLAVQRGPKENGHRPAVDPLFRSAAIAYGPRVVAVVVSGYFDCGTAGLLSVKSRSGIAIVQQPDEAVSDGMPRSAIDHVAIDHVLPVAEIGPLVTRLTMEPAPPPSSKAPPAELLEIEGDEPGLRSSVVCPICQGSLSESQLASVTSFRCHVGHAFTTAGLLAEQAESLERALWAAVRTLEESASVSGRMATFSGPLRSRFEEKARTQTQQADVVRQMLLGSRSLTIVDGENAAAGSVQVASPGTKRPSPPRGRRKMEKKAKPASARTSVAKRVKRAAHRRRDRS